MSKFITVQPGDLFLTGTPSGVGPVRIGDKLLGELKEDGISLCQLQMEIINSKL